MAKADKALTLKPLDDRVVVQSLDAEEKTASGILLPDTAKQKPQQGKVIAVGPGKLSDTGSRTAVAVKVGDTVLFGKYSGTEIKLDGEEYLIMREEEVLGILK